MDLFINILRSAGSLISSAVNHGVHILMPAACSSLIQMSLQDSRIGKIVGGIGLTVAGAGLVAASGIPKSLKSWYWTKPQETSKDSKIIRWGTAVAGLMTAGYGVYNIVSGMLEIAAPYTPHTILHKSYGSDDSRHDSLGSCEDDVLRAKKRLLSCPEAEDLWDEVESAGRFSVRCTADENAPGGAKVWVEDRQILLSQNTPEEGKMEGLLFELNNLKQAKIVSLIGQNKCKFSPDEYAVGLESIEYTTAKETSRISGECVNQGLWPKKLKIFEQEFSGGSSGADDWTSFEKYLEAQEHLGHTDLYRLNWYENCAPERLSAWIASNVDRWRSVLAKSKNKDEL